VASSTQSSPQAAQALPGRENLPKETPDSAASQLVLPSSVEANKMVDILALLIGGYFLASMAAAHISLAVQSIASGNTSVRTVSFTFLAVFLAIVPTLLIISMSAWWKAAKREKDVWKAFKTLDVLCPLGVTTYILWFLLIFYGDMNLGVVGGRVTGVMPKNWEFWTYLILGKLPLFCF